MNQFEKGVISYLGEEKFRKITGVKTGIAGAGGLGSNCAFNLVRCGFKKFRIADYDHVEFSNLNRQFYFGEQVGKLKTESLKENLLRINPDLEIEVINKKIQSKSDLKVFDDCNCIVEAFDKSCFKKMIVEYFMPKPHLLVAGSGLAGTGNSDAIKVRKIKDNFFVVGDMVSGVGKDLPPFSPCTNIAAAKQADIIFSYFCSEKEVQNKTI